jgi:hypothetical protein
MAGTANQPKTTGRPGWWRRIPSFRVAFALSVSAWLAVIGWVFIDRQFPVGPVFNAYYDAFEPEMPYRLPVWSYDDWRLPVLGCLAIIVIGANVVIASRLFVGRAGGRSVSSFLAATALVAAWLSFFAWFDELQWRGFKFRLSQRIPELTAFFGQLRDHWPTEDGTLPGLGRYSIDKNERDTLVGPWHDCAFPEALGRFIRRDSSGAVRTRIVVFDLRRAREFDGEWMLEYFPTGLQPADYSEVRIIATCPPDLRARFDYQLQGSEKLGDGLYLAWYTTTQTELDRPVPSS